MIMQCIHPSDPSRTRWIALGYCKDDDSWIPLERDVKVFDCKFDAGRESLEYVGVLWTCVVRCLWVWQNISEMHADENTDLASLRCDVRALFVAADGVSRDLLRLLSEPRDGDFVSVGGTRVQASPRLRFVLRHDSGANEAVYQLRDIERIEPILDEADEGGV